jgi:hypothetical protein
MAVRGNLTTWVREKAPRQVIQIRDETRPGEEFAAAEPATSQRSEPNLAMKRSSRDGSAARPHAPNATAPPKLGSDAWDATVHPKRTHSKAEMDGTERNRAEHLKATSDVGSPCMKETPCLFAIPPTRLESL